MNKFYQYIKTRFSKELKLINFLLLENSNSETFEIKNVDWNFFISLSKKHRVVSHLIKNPKTNAYLPDDILKTLKSIQLEQLKRSLLYNSELLRVNFLFSKKKIDHLFFKGPLLSYKLYNDIGFRNFRDIDVLVKIEDLENAVSALKDMEYNIIEPEKKLSAKQKKANYKISHHYHLQHSSLPIDIELHWNLTNPKSFLGIPTQKILKKKNQIDFQSYSLPYLSETENIVFLAAHGAIHQWYRLFWIKDFSVLISKLSTKEFNDAWELGERLRLTNCLLQACFLSKILFNAVLPDFIESKSIKKSLIKTTLQSIATTELKQKGIIGKIRYPLYRLSLKPNFKYYFDLIYRLRTHFSDWKMIKLPDSLFFLYYLLRPILMLIKLIKKK